MLWDLPLLARSVNFRSGPSDSCLCNKWRRWGLILNGGGAFFRLSLGWR